MIIKTRTNLPGPYHVRKGIPCQDAYFIKETDDGVVIAAVADGVGSEMYSDVGAKVASNYAVNYCVHEYLPEMTKDEVKRMMRNAFMKAYLEVEKVADRQDRDIEQFDSTLCMAIYDGKKLYYGQSGDSGMIAALQDGSYVKVTKQQRDEEKRVFPLCSGPNVWEFGVVEGDVTAVMLMTDGIWDLTCPSLIQGDKQPVNVAFVDKFLNAYDLDSSEVKAFEKDVSRYIENIPRENVDDDKTVVLLINTDAKPKRMPDEYYSALDFEAIRSKKIAMLEQQLSEVVHKCKAPRARRRAVKKNNKKISKYLSKRNCKNKDSYIVQL